MATALPIALSAPSGATLYAGRYGAGLFGGLTLDDLSPSGALTSNEADLAGTILLDALAPTGSLRGTPSWRAAMTPNTWAIVPISTTLASIDPALDPTLNPNSSSSAPWRGSGGQSKALDAWGSYVPSMTPGDARIWLTCGGGHGDYAGNEHYELDLWAEAPAWVMRRRPSSNSIDGLITLADGQESTGLYSDGRIRSTHIYQTQVHVPGRGIFMSDNTACYYTAGGGPQKAFWITEDGEHSVACDYSALPVTGDHGAVCHDTTRDVLWFTRAATLTQIARYDPNTNAVTAHGSTNSWAGGGSRLIYVAELDLVVNLTSALFYLFNPGTFAWNRSTSTTGTRPAWLIGNLGNCGSAWVPALGCIVLWNNSSSTASLATLTPGANAWSDPWLWGEIAPNAANAVTPPARPGTGGVENILGKFGYLPALNGFYLQTQFSSALHFYALP